MTSKNGDLKVAYERLSAQLKRSEQLTQPLLEFCSRIGPQLDTLPQKDFSKAWLLHLFAVELLKYSIEDDYVETATLRPILASTLQKLVERDDWVEEELAELLHAYNQLATEKPITPRKATLETEVLDKPRKFACRVAQPDEPEFSVSSRTYRLVPILEDSLCNQFYVDDVVDAFTDKLRQLTSLERVTTLCFIEKAVGPIGALAMLSTLVSRLSLPASIYRENYWAERAKLAGYQPKQSDRIAIVYDLLVSGEGILRVVRSLKKKYKAKVVAAVVLLGYGPRRELLHVDKQHTIRINALGWYNTFARQISKFYSKTENRTKNITKGWRSSSSPAKRETVSSPLTQGGINMRRSPRWVRPFSMYGNEELRAVKFSSVKELRRAIRLFWEDPDLKGVPRDTPDGRTVILPEEALELLRAKGFKFTVSRILGSSDLTPERLAELSEEYGM
jgi:hypothetical protein